MSLALCTFVLFISLMQSANITLSNTLFNTTSFRYYFAAVLAAVAFWIHVVTVINIYASL